MKYLGGMLCSDGSCMSAVTSRLGEARNSFEKLAAIWKHSNLTEPRKIAIYKACVVTKLMYGLEVYCLKKVERDRVDAFHARCLRKILGIPHSMISRVSDATVLSRACGPALSVQIVARQVMLFGFV